ncbi:50S ribosomal protein L11 methyltransferase [Spirochaetota bacterium]
MKPIEKLFIYEIKGDVSLPAKSLSKSFLGCWREGGHSYLFFSSFGKEEVLNFLTRNSEYEYISETEIDYDLWEPADTFRSIEVQPLTVVPAWYGEDKNNKMQIRIDPGVVFGAGNHHTTRKCLQFLVDLMADNNISKVLDIGTGTGILAIAAVKLGASEVLAVDNNNLAVETAVMNVKLNGLHRSVNCRTGDAVDYTDFNADLTLANMNLFVLEKMFNLNRTFGSDWYIVSGLNGAEVGNFQEIIADLPFEVLRHEMENLWSTLLLRKV